MASNDNSVDMIVQEPERIGFFKSIGTTIHIVCQLLLLLFTFLAERLFKRK